jgi:hypothetical protein
VAAVLSSHVDGNGNLCKPGDYNDRGTLLKVLAQNAIKDAATVAVKQWVTEQAPAIREEISRILGKQKGGLAKAMVDGLQKTLGDNGWRFSVSCNFAEEK